MQRSQVGAHVEWGLTKTGWPHCALRTEVGGAGGEGGGVGACADVVSCSKLTGNWDTSSVCDSFVVVNAGTLSTLQRKQR